ncbi:hypothetical protein ABIB37_001972 [Agrococcus sp. UYP10]|uniref:hypothetical protein n=1 Tax=Agrococcus sp. UYP10 TaxID=1756355 RepID=UPI0033927534
MPGDSNTGVPSGVALRVHRGNMVITQANTVISGLDIYGSVDVRAANVTIRNSIVRGDSAGNHDFLVRSASNTASLRIYDTTLRASKPTYRVNGLRGWNINANRLDISNVIDPAHFWGSGNVQLRNSWLHDNLHYASDPSWNGNPSHDDSVQIQSGSGYWITGNRIEDANNAGIMITQDAGRVANVMIRDNFLDGGGCTINLHDKGKGRFQNIDIVGNIFGANSAFNCQIIRTAGDITATANTTVTGKAMRINLH